MTQPLPFLSISDVFLESIPSAAQLLRYFREVLIDYLMSIGFSWISQSSFHLFLLCPFTFLPLKFFPNVTIFFLWFLTISIFPGLGSLNSCVFLWRKCLMPLREVCHLQRAFWYHEDVLRAFRTFWGLTQEIHSTGNIGIPLYSAFRSIYFLYFFFFFRPARDLGGL